MKKILIAFGAVVVTGFAFANVKKPIDSIKPAVVSEKAPVVTVSLKANRTTGYRWYLVRYDSNVVVPISEKYEVPSSKLVGASGKDIWTFRIKSSAFSVPRITIITLAYAQSWNLKGAMYKHIPLVIRS